MRFDDDSEEESFDESDEIEVFNEKVSSGTGSIPLVCRFISCLQHKATLLLEYSASAGTIAGSSLNGTKKST